MKCKPSYTRWKKFFLSLLISIGFQSSTSVSALETDQYMVWEKPLNDISAYLNGFINKRTWSVLNTVNQLPTQQRKRLNCEAIHKMVLASYNKNKGLDFISEIERRIYDDPTLSRYPPITASKLAIIKQSIYKKSQLFKLKMFGINIKVNGIYLGVDKIDHVLRTGYLYFKAYQRYRNKGHSEKQALIAAIKKGIIQEKTYFGYWVSGVFSYADLEANYQGLRFHRDFCGNQNPYLNRTDKGTWHLSQAIDIREYINPWFDESYNNSAYLGLRFNSVYPELKKYCPFQNSAWLQRRNDYYQQWQDKESFSVRYLQHLVTLGQLDNPKQYSLNAICARQ
jgi:hypothetical protein